MSKKNVIGSGRPYEVSGQVQDQVISVGDLFCGAGGFSEGFKQAGFKIDWAVDNWDVAIQTHKMNHPDTKHYLKDIKELTGDNLGYVDIVIGSPPCVSFSRNQNGRKIPDDSLIKESYRIISEIKPKYWVLENVAQARNHFHGIKSYLKAMDFGVPQIRNRMFITNFTLPLFPKLSCSLKDVFPNGNLLRNLAHSGANGKRWKEMNEVCWTLDTADSLRIDGRNLTIPELKKISGFSDDYIFDGVRTKIVKQIGNVVCPQVAKAIANVISDNPEIEFKYKLDDLYDVEPSPKKRQN